MAFLPQVPQSAFHLLGLPEVDLLASSHSTQCQHYYTLESQLPLGALGLNAFNHPWTFQVSYVCPPSALVPLVLSKFLAEHVKDQLRCLILEAPCWMEVPWIPTVHNMLADIPQWCPIIKDLFMDVLVGQALKGLPYLHLTLRLLSNVCYADRVLFLSLSSSGGGNLSVYVKGLSAVLEGLGRLMCSTGCTKLPSLPLN